MNIRLCSLEGTQPRLGLNTSRNVKKNNEDMSSNKPWCVIEHVPYEGPGLISEIGQQRGIEFKIVRSFAGEHLPDWKSVGGLIVMGGPMGLTDEEEIPGLEEEMGLIWVLIDQHIPVLGVCLGAQLMAGALGAQVTRGNREEVGIGTVKLVGDGLVDPVLGPSGPVIPVFHWHSDTFKMPDGARHLAESHLYRNQAFKMGDLAYGFQFHVELDSELAGDLSPHLPAGVKIEQELLEQVESAGRQIIGRFFDLATKPS